MHFCWLRSSPGTVRAADRRPCHRNRQPVRLSVHRNPRRHRVPRGIAGMADRAPPARHRSHGSAPAGRPRQSRAAIAIHRPEPAREHRRRRPREPHPPHQRIRGDTARRSQRLSGRAARRSLTAAALPTRNLAGASVGRCGTFADLRRSRRWARRAAAFRAARRVRADAGHRISRGHGIALGQDPAVQARGAGTTFRQHRARNPQPGRRHEPCRAVAG